MEKSIVKSEYLIKNRILTLRGLQVMVDRDLAELYEVSTSRLNEQVKRNIDRFPDDFMFQLTEKERYELVAKCDRLNKIKHSTYPPFVFTEQGVASLSGVLKSKQAVEVNIHIMRAFVAMRRFLASNSQIYHRLDYIDKRLLSHDQKFELVFRTIERKDLKPDYGIFYDGQMFDAYKFVNDLIKSARKSIILIDNYVDASVLAMFSERKKQVKVKIYTKNLTDKLRLDLEKFNSQYPPIKIIKFTKSHDRFMIIDEKELYHIGASLKDVGKKWFAFSRLDESLIHLLEY